MEKKNANSKTKQKSAINTWDIKGLKENLKTAQTKECVSEVRMNNCQKPTSRYNFKIIDISDETPMEMFSVF